jgi:hypothetical protein
MNHETSRRLVIRPESQEDLSYWTRKWGVNARQIYDAILDTGSLRLEDIRLALWKKRAFTGWTSWWYRFFGIS